MLKSYYGVAKGKLVDDGDDPLSMDSPAFDIEAYMDHLLKTTDFEGIMKTRSDITKRMYLGMRGAREEMREDCCILP